MDVHELFFGIVFFHGYFFKCFGGVYTTGSMVHNRRVGAVVPTILPSLSKRHLSNETNLGWLGYIGDEKLPSYIGHYNKPLYKDPY